MRKVLLGLVVVLAGCGTLHEKYVRQDRANYETLAPRVRKMMAASEVYSPMQEKDIEDRLVACDTLTAVSIATIDSDIAAKEEAE